MIGLTPPIRRFPQILDTLNRLYFKLHKHVSKLIDCVIFYFDEYYLLFTILCYVNLIQDVELLVFTAVTVTLLVPQTVKITRVTYRMERVSRVNLDGMEYIVVQVR